MSATGLFIDPSTFDIYFARGDDQTIRFAVTNPDGTAKNITGWTFKFTVKKSIDDAIGAAKFQKTTGGGGIVLTTPASGILDVSVAAADTQALAGRHYYDLQGRDAGGLIGTQRIASFVVLKNVTDTGVAGQPSAPGAPFPGWISIGGVLYMLDATTGLYGAFRLNNGFWEQSLNQGLPPFTF
jgi:hypothetical protein